MVLNNLFYLFILTTTLMANSVLYAQKDVGWQLVKNYDGIKAYVQKVPNSQFKKIKIETIVQASLSELISIFKDANNHSNWVYLSKNAEIAEVIDDFNWIYYSLSDAPWPVSNRDYYTSVVLEQNMVDYSITLTSCAIPNFKDQVKDCVRIQFIHSVWKLNPIGNGSVHITFELEVDPGGNIPAWVVNMVITKGPFNTILGLKKELNIKRHHDVKLDYIEEM